MDGIRFTLTIATEMKSIRNDRLIGIAYRDTTLSSESLAWLACHFIVRLWSSLRG